MVGRSWGGGDAVFVRALRIFFGKANAIKHCIVLILVQAPPYNRQKASTQEPTKVPYDEVRAENVGPAKLLLKVK